MSTKLSEDEIAEKRESVARRDSDYMDVSALLADRETILAELAAAQKLVSLFSSSKVHGQAIEDDDHWALDQAGVPRTLEGDTEEATCGDRVRWLHRKHQAELASCRAELAEAKTALEIVATGIWRDKKMNACGLTGAALAVHAVEKIIGKKKTNKLSKP